MRKIRKIEWAIAIALILAIIVAIDIYTGENALGATARFLYNGILWARAALERFVLWAVSEVWRVAFVMWERFVAYSGIVFAGRITRALAVLTMGVGMGYFLSGGAAKRWYRARERLRHIGVKFKEGWHALPFLGKVAVAVALIAVQVYEEFWVLLFPIGFMIPVVVFVYDRIKRFLVGYVFANWYRARYGAVHSRVVRKLAHETRAKSVVQPLRFTELLFRSGWRLWRYDPRYRVHRGWRREVYGRVRIAKDFFDGYWHRYLRCHHLLGWNAHTITNEAAP